MISLRCLVGGHAPSTTIIANGGYRFSHCRRCGVEIVQSVVSPWRVPQKGFRITWRSDQRPAARVERKTAPPTPAIAQPIRQASAAARPVSDFMGADDDGFDWMDAQESPRASSDVPSKASKRA